MNRQSSQIRVEEEKQVPYLLRPIHVPARLENLTILSSVDNPEELEFLFSERDETDYLVVDLETKGTRPFVKDTPIVGIGFSDSRGSLYVDLRESHPDTLKYLITQMAERQVPLIAHNVAFDAAFLLREALAFLPEDKAWLNWTVCTYALYRHVATEKFFLQTYGLKDAQKDLLLWEESNDVELDKWLIDNGYFNRGQSGPTPKKAEMWRAPSDILGYYCALDCDSTYLLFKHVFEPLFTEFPHLKTFHTKYFMNHEELLARQQLSGIHINVPKLTKYRDFLETEVTSAEFKFLTHEKVSPFVEMYNSRIIGELLEKQPEMYLKKKERAEPPRYKKDGSESINWRKWRELEAVPPSISKNWEKWEVKYKAALSACHFNMNSDMQMRELLYDYLQFEPKVFTDSGLPSTGGDALKGFGEVGKLIDKYSELTKELEYVQSCLDYVALSHDGETLHPQFKVPGTFTGRLAGGSGSGEDVNVNVQQIPKTRGYLECWEARPGKVWIQADFSALEQVVLAAFSKDEALMGLYGPEAKANDVYLYNGAHMNGLKEKILATGYNPYEPTPESIAHAKKVCKRERGIAKVITLASSYGAGATKIQNSLSLEGINLSVEEVEEIHKGYWDLYSGVKKYQEWLESFWEESGGWVPTALGRPITLCKKYIKDILNMVIQSSGHSILVLYCYYWSQGLKEAGIPFTGIIVDFHDESIIEINKEDADKVLKIFQEATDKVNKYLDSDVKLSATPQVVNTMAEVKLEG